MKKTIKFAYAVAIALVSMGFTACSSNDDEQATTNPTYDGKAVKTQFSIALPGNLAKTRMSYATVQAAEDIASFRGMSNIVIIPFSHATDRTARLGNNITLGENKMKQPVTTNAENAVPNGQLLANSNAVLYSDVNIPIGTSGFLFYGKATGTDGYAEGALTAAGLTGEPSGISFTPVPIQTSFTSSKGQDIADYVTAIAAAADGDAAWYKCANTANSAETWYSVALGDLYNSFTNLKPGASAYVQAAVQDLYTTLLPNTDVVSMAIKAAIKDGTNAKDENNDGTLEFQDVINGYPGTVYNSMPDGTASLTWSDATPKVATANASNAVLGSGATQEMAKIVYPAALYYYVDSPLQTADASREQFYDGTNNWSTILGKYNGTSVAPATRSVAITKPIQYAVGRLDVTVNALASGTTYYDRRGEAVVVPTEGFQLTGVLIGGQKAVDYKFEQNTSATEYAIYDKTINTEAASGGTVSAYVKAGTAAGPNYTLALETAENQAVYVVLEFLNDGTGAKDFMGVDGVVKKGCKFYMIAQLKSDADVTGQISGTSSTGNKVFKQDFKTIANFTFGVGSQDLNTGSSTDGVPDGVADAPAGFANAYVNIPDLRTPQLELGFSVDLTWRAGITYDITF